MGTIVVALDGSELAESALEWVSPLARALGDDIHLVSVHPWDEELWTYAGIDPGAPLARVRDTLDAYLQKVAQREQLAGLSITQSVVAGDPAREIERAAEGGDTRLVALTTHGRGSTGSQRGPGSVAVQLARMMSQPVLVVPPHGIPASMDGIVAALDGSEDATRALPMARTISTGLGAPLHLVEVVGADAGWGLLDAEHDALVQARVQRARENLAAAGLQGETVAVEQGPVLDGILEYARGHGCGLIVMATHGRSGRAYMDLGSTADAMMRVTDRPLLLVPVRPAADNG